MGDNSRILLVCDDEQASRQLRELLIIEGGYPVSFESSAQGALNALRQNTFDIIIVKFGVLDVEAEELIKGLKRIDPDCVIIGFMEDSRPQTLSELFKAGVYDVITKPINTDKLFFLIKKGTELRSFANVNKKLMQGLREHNVSLEKQNILLAKRIEDSTKNLSKLYEDLRSTYMHTIKVLAQAIDARDHYTHSHSENVAKIAVAIANELNFSAKDIEILREACELHDLGKIGVEDRILTKPSGLNEEEWLEIKKHPVIGAQILEPLTFLSDVIEMVREHHEHYDGTGYPEGRKGEDILLGARIIHLADAYEAMRSARSYRKTPLTKEDAIAEIRKNTGTQFDPKVAAAFLRIVDKVD